MKILVVDDDPHIVRVLKLRLNGNDYEVLTAQDGIECIQIAETELPDLILLDIKMPKGGGVNAFEVLKSTVTTEDIPVIFMTAYPSPEIKEQVIEMGAIDFIPKPFDGGQLIEKITSILSNKVQ